MSGRTIALIILGGGGVQAASLVVGYYVIAPVMHHRSESKVRPHRYHTMPRNCR